MAKGKGTQGLKKYGISQLKKVDEQSFSKTKDTLWQAGMAYLGGNIVCLKDIENASGTKYKSEKLV